MKTQVQNAPISVNASTIARSAPALNQCMIANTSDCSSTAAIVPSAPSRALNTMPRNTISSMIAATRIAPAIGGTPCIPRTATTS
ncbi:hypothetical protein D3C85_1727890 [compost metagenome]